MMCNVLCKVFAGGSAQAARLMRQWDGVAHSKTVYQDDDKSEFSRPPNACPPITADASVITRGILIRRRFYYPLKRTQGFFGALGLARSWR
jgi:hypothetical protein